MNDRILHLIKSEKRDLTPFFDEKIMAKQLDDLSTLATDCLDHIKKYMYSENKYVEDERTEATLKFGTSVMAISCIIQYISMAYRLSFKEVFDYILLGQETLTSSDDMLKILLKVTKGKE